MARHRRYQSKKHHGHSNSNKDKQKSGKEKLFKSHDGIDDQPIPKSIKEVQKQIQLAKNSVNIKRKKRPKNRLLEESAKMGYFQKPWENSSLLFERVERDTRRFVRDEIVKARYGIAGRNEKEIEKDYKELDEKAKRKKLQKIAEIEKMKKAKEKAEQWKKTAKKLDHPDGYFSSEDIQEKEEDGDERELKAPKHEATKNSSPLKRRLGKNEKLKLKKKQIADDVQKDLILNAREIIPFGERVDEPPQLPKLKKLQFQPVKAGSKDLLLKQLLERENENRMSEENLNQLGKSTQKVTDGERQRIIELYRKTKKKNNDHVSL